MPQRIDAGPALAALGALLLAVSLFLDWFELAGASVTGWGAFEAVDLLLFGLALAALVLAATRIGADGAGDARLLPALGAVAVFVVAVQILDPPPSVSGGEVAEGGWLALAGGLLLALGGVLAAASISVVVTVAGRETRRRVPAVDRRRRRPAAEAPARPAAGGEEDATADAPAAGRGGAASLFAEGPPSPDDQRTQAFDVGELQPREQREPREPREGGRRGGTGG